MKYIDNPEVVLIETDFPETLKHLIPYFVEWCFLDIEDVYVCAKSKVATDVIDFVSKMNAAQSEIEKFIALGNQQIPISDEYVIVDLTFSASDALDARAMLLQTQDETGDFRDRFRNPESEKK